MNNLFWTTDPVAQLDRSMGLMFELPVWAFLQAYYFQFFLLGQLSQSNLKC